MTPISSLAAPIELTSLYDPFFGGHTKAEGWLDFIARSDPDTAALAGHAGDVRRAIGVAHARAMVALARARVAVGAGRAPGRGVARGVEGLDAALEVAVGHRRRGVEREDRRVRPRAGAKR